MLLGGDVAYNVVGVIAHAEFGDDTGGVDNFSGEDNGLAEVVLVGVVGAGALGVHVGDANAALLVGLETLASGDIVEDCASHGVDVAEEETLVLQRHRSVLLSFANRESLQLSVS